MDGAETIAGVVLAGGQSSRMGGGDKCLQPLGGKPLLAHVLARLSPQVSQLAINANGNPSRFDVFGLPVVADNSCDFQGPLAGIEAGLRWATNRCPNTAWAVTVAGDTPFIPSDLVARLLQAVREAPMAVATSGEGLHPVVGIWPVTMAQALADNLASGKRKATDWVKSQGAAEVFFDAVEIGGTQVDPFFNINRPDDLRAAEALLKRES
ncbi:MAG: molybdenum cofactor guanylyltransferase MobA [Methyloceanibacter sp.]|jgi:molybdopterin-guanine dinucleotide biosynthesis protein A|uniref:molybdenum cofactor guanylyltransferase MobA n=1 Tax=Methyloceanibacter sp. TaxID=1965321 RepID=UPI003561DECD